MPERKKWRHFLLSRVLTDGALKAIEGSAVISHKHTGELLFYSDGRNFWNRNHEQMQHAHALPGNCYTRISQPAIIIPSPEDESIYHVFCIRAEHEAEPLDPNNCTYHRDRSKLGEGESGYNLYYYRVDMRLDNGLGNVVEAESNILLQRNITGKLTALPHTNGTDHWVVVHGWQDNVFHAHRLSRGGEIVGSVTSAIGSTHGTYGGIYFEDELMGELKASPDGTKIAAGVFSDYRPFDLFDFDASTGILSNYVNLGDVKGQYGVSFSPDNSKLYVSSDSRDRATGRLHVILQYDLHAGGPAAIASSGMSVIVGNPHTNIPSNGIFDGWSTAAKGMALAPDGGLYITGNDPTDGASENHTLVVIERPNERGYNCGINYRKFDFAHGSTGIGLPNFMQSWFNNIQPLSVCEAHSSISVYPNPTPGPTRLELRQGCPLDYTVSVFNSLGQIIWSPLSLSAVQNEIDLTGLSDGLYLLRFTSPRGKVNFRRLLKASE